MNKLINSLVDATAAMVPGVYRLEYESGKKGVEFNEEALNKFVELIVKDCAEVIGYYYTRNECVSPTQIKKHFGVEQ